MVMRQNGARRGGFLLVDCLIAMSLMAGAVVATVALYRSVVRDCRVTQERLSAALVARSELERLRAIPYDRIPAGAATRLPLTLPAAQHLKGAGEFLTVRELEPGLKEATVRVEWESPQGRPLMVEMGAVFSREGGAR